LQVSEYFGVGYRPLVDYGAWRVAVLRYIDELEPQNIGRMQRHNETDEVFVLLAGRCILFLGEGGESVERIEAEDLQPYKLYNVRRGAWHTHTLDRDAHVLIIENRDTCNENSPHTPLTGAQTDELVRLTREIWGFC
jgi:hypothetical protein